jgi:hemerythrin-like domain-containing protein
MAVPLDAIRAIHNAFRKDLEAMDSAARNAAEGSGSLDLILKRYSLFSEILDWHAKGEEEYVFPVLEKVAPLVAEAYLLDHRGLDTLTESLNKAIKGSDTLRIACSTSAFNFFLDHHLDSEEAHLYRIFNESVSLSDQGVIIGKMSQRIPQERFPEVVTWLYPLLEPDDRENMARIMRQALPAPVFAGVARLIHTVIGDDWAELIRRIPDLK